MKRGRLFTPGPTSVPSDILLEMAKPIIHHRTDEFKKIVKEAHEGLKYVFQTENNVMTLASSGTGAMEAAVVNLLSKGDKVIVITGGKFGERFAEIAGVYGVEVIKLEVEWGKALAPEELDETLQQNPDVKVVFSTLCETSTGTHFDIKGFGKVVSKYENTVLVVDAVSSLGAVPCLTDQWNIDVVVSGSQKALMLPPGLSFISFSEKAWKMAEKSDLPKYYLDLKKCHKKIEDCDFPYTMAVTLVIALKKAVDMIKEQTIERVWDEHSKRAEATRQAFKKLRFRLLSKNPSDALTAIVLPEGVDSEKLVKLMRSKYGISIAGGQEKLKGKIIRISHLGWQDEFDVLTAICAVEVGLQEMGYKINTEDGMLEAKKILFG
jgi:serine---pyruvate transaminase